MGRRNTLWVSRRLVYHVVLVPCDLQLAGYIPRYAKFDEPFIADVNHWPVVREAQRQVLHLFIDMTQACKLRDA